MGFEKSMVVVLGRGVRERRRFSKDFIVSEELDKFDSDELFVAFRGAFINLTPASLSLGLCFCAALVQ